MISKEDLKNDLKKFAIFIIINNSTENSDDRVNAYYKHNITYEDALRYNYAGLDAEIDFANSDKNLP